jgi:hypothetical protein
MTRPTLQPGQVWQCRDQSYVFTVVSDIQILTPRSIRLMARYRHGQRLVDSTGDRTLYLSPGCPYYHWDSRCEEGPIDWMRLLYCPTWVPQGAP